MKLACPVCGSKFSLEHFHHDGMLRELADLAARFGKVWTLAYEYIDCFRRSELGSVTLKRRIALARELLKMFEAKAIEYDRKRYRAEPRQLVEAMQIAVTNQKHGFDNHNYIKKILVNNGAKKLSAEGLTATEEHVKEQEKASRPSTDNGDLELISYKEFVRQNA